MTTLLGQHLKRALAGAMFASLLCLHGSVKAATEVEPNDTKEQAQALAVSSTGEAKVSAVLGTGSGVLTEDIDIYSFEGKADEVPTITLWTNGDWDAMLYLYDSAGNMLYTNDDAYPPTQGSLCTTDRTVKCDPRIDLYRLEQDATYYIAVGPAMRYLFTNFEVHPAFLAPQPGGAYDLLLQGVTPSDNGMAEISISIMNPDTSEASLGLFNGKKPIPVAIHSALPDFAAARDVDRRSLTFGATGEEKSLVRCDGDEKKGKAKGGKHQSDDLVCYFRADLSGIQVGDMSAVLKGSTKDGRKFTGGGMLRVFSLPAEQSKTWYERHGLDPRTVKPKKVK